MPSKRVGELSAAKDAQLKLRLTPTLDKRLAMLSAMTGDSKTSIAGAAMVMGLRLLETSIMGPDLAAASMEDAAKHLMQQMEADVDVALAEKAEIEARAKPKRAARKSEPESEPESAPGVGFVRRRAELDEHGSFDMLADALAFR